ncbi:hypothetical protein L228DRAFT_268951 [Xylona heveae TC161]|uniref:DUF7730 domain-containing protein n=1 Tax=Xylona heveae (strain CBS 132557 / TC161) TaxID=1328760 RepID=A0A165FWN2_XYLHT|nr:hypothetical protein L228DRAFT_268951 [Xylona heveae TC161]KZF21474.1 hypothetical protein L228DRAFT_268951 [Xylona heveae TC161]
MRGKKKPQLEQDSHTTMGHSGKSKETKDRDGGSTFKPAPTTPKKIIRRLPSGWNVTKLALHRSAKAILPSPAPPLPPTLYHQTECFYQLRKIQSSLSELERRFGPNIDRPSPKPFRLMGLPKFIRQRIFDLLIVSNEPLMPYQHSKRLPQRGNARCQSSSLNLLLVNRTIYLDVLEELYGSNHFSFSFPTTLLLFLSTIGPRNAQLLRHLVIRFTLAPPDGTLAGEPGDADATYEVRRERSGIRARGVGMEMETMVERNGPWALPQLRNLAHWLFLSRLSPFPSPDPESHTGRVFVGSPNAFAQSKLSADCAKGSTDDPSAPFFWLKPGPRKDVQANHRAAVAVFTRMWADTLGVLLPGNIIAQMAESLVTKHSSVNSARASPPQSIPMPVSVPPAQPIAKGQQSLSSPHLPLPPPPPTLPGAPPELARSSCAAKPVSEFSSSKAPLRAGILLPLESISGEVPPPCWSAPGDEKPMARPPVRSSRGYSSANPPLGNLLGDTSDNKKRRSRELKGRSKRQSWLCSKLKTMHIVFENNARCLRGCCNSRDVLSRASSTVPADVISQFLPQLHAGNTPQAQGETDGQQHRLRSQTSRPTLRNAPSHGFLRHSADATKLSVPQPSFPDTHRHPQLQHQPSLPLLRHNPSQPVLRKISDPITYSSSQSAHRQQAGFTEAAHSSIPGSGSGPGSGPSSGQPSLRPILRYMSSQPIMRERSTSNTYRNPRTPIYGSGPSNDPLPTTGANQPPPSPQAHYRYPERSDAPGQSYSPRKPEPQPRRLSGNLQASSAQRDLPKRSQGVPQPQYHHAVQYRGPRPRVASAASAPVVPMHSNTAPRRASDGSQTRSSEAAPQFPGIAPIYGAGPNLSDVHSSGALSDTPTGPSFSQVLTQLRELNVEVFLSGMARRPSSQY